MAPRAVSLLALLPVAALVAFIAVGCADEGGDDSGDAFGEMVWRAP